MLKLKKSLKGSNRLAVHLPRLDGGLTPYFVPRRRLGLQLALQSLEERRRQHAPGLQLLHQPEAVVFMHSARTVLKCVKQGEPRADQLQQACADRYLQRRQQQSGTGASCTLAQVLLRLVRILREGFLCTRCAKCHLLGISESLVLLIPHRCRMCLVGPGRGGCTSLGYRTKLAPQPTCKPRHGFCDAGTASTRGGALLRGRTPGRCVLHELHNALDFRSLGARASGGHTSLQGSFCTC